MLEKYENASNVYEIFCDYYKVCPGCGSTETTRKVLVSGNESAACTCPGCGGLLAVGDLYGLSKYVKTSSGMMQSDGGNNRYFDIYRVAQNQRVHGWYDEETKNVVQYG